MEETESSDPPSTTYQSFTAHSGARLIDTLSIGPYPIASITCDFDKERDPKEIVEYVDTYSDETLVLTSTLSDGYCKLNVNIISRVQNSTTTIEVSETWMRVYISPENKTDVSHLLSSLAAHPEFDMDVVIPVEYC